jgi:putative mRNA 3-end processing factor
MMQLTALGAMDEVGRSAFLVDTGVEKIVMDYGTKVRTAPPQFPIPVKGRPDAILLSHAHLDHSGGLPIFYANDHSVPIFGIEVTKEISELLLRDSIKISTEEGIHLPFDSGDLSETLKNFIPINYRKSFKLKKTEITAFDAGHIPGSVMFLLEFGGKKLLYTGDYNSADTRLLKGCDEKIPEVDYLVTESTYADREHLNRKGQEKELNEVVNDTIRAGGVCIVSGFAVGRLQEIVLVLNKLDINYPIYMDGMAKNATTIINKWKKLLKNPDELDTALSKVQYVNSDNMRKKIVKKPCVILTTSGMLTGGAVVQYIKRLYDDRKSSLLLTGYQLEDTPGKILLQTGRYITKGMELELKMFIKRFDFSAHVGKTGLYDFIKKLNPEKIFCVHGDHTDEFADQLKEKGFDAVAPVANNRIFTL